ncbi:MAG: DUF6922 domain-containing protein [Bacteroidota bacterium]
MKKNQNDLEILKPLFWEYDWGSVEENLASSFVIARVLELGDPKQFRLFAELVGEDSIKIFLREKGEKLLSPQSLNFWKLYYRI